jgi:hypothetical protein
MTSMNDANNQDLSAVFSDHLVKNNIPRITLEDQDNCERYRFINKKFTITGDYFLALQAYHSDESYFQELFSLLQIILSDDKIEQLNKCYTDGNILNTRDEVHTKSEILYNLFVEFDEEICSFDINSSVVTHSENLIKLGHSIRESMDIFEKDLLEIGSIYFFCKCCDLIINNSVEEVDESNEFTDNLKNIFKYLDNFEELKEKLVIITKYEIKSFTEPPKYLTNLLDRLTN